MGGGPYYAQLGGSRILNTSRVDQSGADDAGVSGWTKTDIVIVAVCIHSGGKETEAAQYKLRWRDETDSPGGAFGDLDTTGECKFGDATALVNGTNLTEANRRTSSQGDTWQAGEEIEGTKLSDSIDLVGDYETELQFAVSLADGDDDHQHTFDLYDDTRGAQVGVLGAQITLEAGAQTFYQNTGQAAMAIAGALNKQGYKDTGGHALVMAGSLGTVATFPVSVGGHAMSIAGTLTSVVTFACSCGAHAMAIAGSLIKQTSKFPGGHAMSITGGLIRKTSKTMGSHAMTIAGTLATATIFLQAVGGHAMSIVGSIIKKTSIFIGNGVVSPVGSLARKTSIFMGKASVIIAGSLGTVVTFLQAAGGHAMTIVGSLVTDKTEGGSAFSKAYLWFWAIRKKKFSKKSKE